MDFKRYLFICGIVPLLLSWCKAGCKEDLEKDSKFNECKTRVISHVLPSVISGSLTDVTDAANLICRPEGKAAVGCFIPYLHKCPALMEGLGVSNLMRYIKPMPAFDLQLLKGGIEAICAVLVGPCSEVNDCFANFTEETDGFEKRDVSDFMNSHINNYQMFTVKTLKICGSSELKMPMACMLEALDQCPPSVMDTVENKFKEARNVATHDEFGSISFQDAKHFILNVCPKMPKDFVASKCFNVLSSPNFTECNTNATMTYSEEKTCTVRDLSKHCIMTHLEPTCGAETTSFYVQNTQLIFPGLPTNCEAKFQGAVVTNQQSSANDVNATVIAIPFQLLLLLSFFSLNEIWIV